MKKYYGLRIESTMCGVVSYFLADTKAEVKLISGMFKAYLNGEDEELVKAWEEFVYEYPMNWCDEYNDHKVGKIEGTDNLYTLVADVWDDNKTTSKAYVFEMVENYIERF